MDKSNRYFSESIGRGRDEYETFFSQEKLLPGGKGPSENPADIGPGELFSGVMSGSAQVITLLVLFVNFQNMRIDTDHMEIEIQAKGSKGGRNKSPSLIANIPIIDLQKTAKMP